MTGSITATVAVSALTSAIVSLTTFVIGVRLSKDQGDRPVLRALYQRLFEHFSELRAAIQDGQPKAWSSFPHKNNEFVPPFRAMQQSGEVNLLPPGLAQECERAEREALSAGSLLKRWLQESYVPNGSRLSHRSRPGRREGYPASKIPPASRKPAQLIR